MLGLKDLLDLIPGENAPPEHVYRYRILWAVFGLTVVWSFMISWGHVTWISKGLARADQVDVQISAMDDRIAFAQAETKKGIDRVENSIQRLTDLFLKEKERTLRSEIFNARQAQCRATAAGTHAGAITSRLVELREEYRKLTGNNYPIPTCEEVR